MTVSVWPMPLTSRPAFTAAAVGCSGSIIPTVCDMGASRRTGASQSVVLATGLGE